MDNLLLVTRLLLALVFAVSGMVKLRDARGSLRAMQDFGMPPPLARLAGTGLPLAELMIAVLLVPAFTAWWGATAALLLLLVFTGAIAYQLARGRRPECNCFGAFESAPIGPRTLARNGVLSMMALTIILHRLDDVQTTLAWTWAEVSPMMLLVSVLSLGVVGVVVFQAWITVAVYQRLSRRMADLTAEMSSTNGRVRRRQMGEVVALSVGEPAPVLELPELQGDIVDLASFKGFPLMLVFVRPGCWACDALLPALKKRDASPPDGDVHLVVISRGRPEENKDLIDLQSPVLLSPNSAVAQAFGVGGTPAALALDADGYVASDVVIGIGPVRALLDPLPEYSHVQSASAPPRNRWRQGLSTSRQRIVAMLRNAGA